MEPTSTSYLGMGGAWVSTLSRHSSTTPACEGRMMEIVELDDGAGWWRWMMGIVELDDGVEWWSWRTLCLQV